jgi:hypothetical protein
MNEELARLQSLFQHVSLIDAGLAVLAVVVVGLGVTAFRYLARNSPERQSYCWDYAAALVGSWIVAFILYYGFVIGCLVWLNLSLPPIPARFATLVARSTVVVLAIGSVPVAMVLLSVAETRELPGLVTSGVLLATHAILAARYAWLAPAMAGQRLGSRSEG